MVVLGLNDSIKRMREISEKSKQEHIKFDETLEKVIKDTIDSSRIEEERKRIFLDDDYFCKNCGLPATDREDCEECGQCECKCDCE